MPRPTASLADDPLGAGSAGLARPALDRDGVASGVRGAERACLGPAMTTRHGLWLGLALAAATAPFAGAVHACDYSSGFKSLHDLLPDMIGGCLTDEQRDPASGDVQQRAAGGLLVWRRDDNTPAFTDGYHTWVLGPYGLQHRLAGERLPWESTTPPEPVPLDVAPIYLNGVVLSDFRAGRDDPRYGAAPALPDLHGRESAHRRRGHHRHAARVLGAVRRAGRQVRYPSSVASPDSLPPEGLLPGSATRVLIYALIPSPPASSRPRSSSTTAAGCRARASCWRPSRSPDAPASPRPRQGPPRWRRTLAAVQQPDTGAAPGGGARPPPASRAAAAAARTAGCRRAGSSRPRSACRCRAISVERRARCRPRAGRGPSASCPA